MKARFIAILLILCMAVSIFCMSTAMAAGTDTKEKNYGVLPSNLVFFTPSPTSTPTPSSTFNWSIFSQSITFSTPAPEKKTLFDYQDEHTVSPATTLKELTQKVSPAEVHDAPSGAENVRYNYLSIYDGGTQPQYIAVVRFVYNGCTFEYRASFFDYMEQDVVDLTYFYGFLDEEETVKCAGGTYDLNYDKLTGEGVAIWATGKTGSNYALYTPDGCTGNNPVLKTVMEKIYSCSSTNDSSSTSSTQHKICGTCGASGLCQHCFGSGRKDCTYSNCAGGTCLKCGGAGYYYVGDHKRYCSCNNGRCKFCGGKGYTDCVYCNGTGDCHYCNGTGWLK